MRVVSDDATREYPIDGLAADAAFLAQLGRGGVRAIHTQETTLDETFISVTGGTLD